jgi:hypothetical protein
LPVFRPIVWHRHSCLCPNLGCSPRLRGEPLLFRSRAILAIFVAQALLPVSDRCCFLRVIPVTRTVDRRRPRLRCRILSYRPAFRSCSSPRLRSSAVSFCFSDHARTSAISPIPSPSAEGHNPNSGDYVAMSAISAISLPPPPHFSIFVANKALHLNRPLGLPCVALG